MDPVVLSDGVVRLVVPEAGDVDRIALLAQDPEVQRWTRVPSPYRREDAVWFLEHVVRAGWQSGRELTWTIRDATDGQLVGMIGLHDHEPGGAAEVGYWMGAAFRGRGWMTRALGLVADHAFADLGMDHLTWSAGVGNHGSRRVAWRTGFRVEGTARRWVEQRGSWMDAWVGTLLREDPRQPAGVWLEPVPLAGRLPDGTPLLLRRFRPDDADAVAEACTDPVSRQWLGTLPSPYTREVALDYISGRETAHADAVGVHWAAELGEGGPAVGAFSLMADHREMLVDGRLGGGTAEVGYWVHPRERGRGVAAAAVGLLVEHAWRSVDGPDGCGGLGLRRLTLAHADGNHASGRVARRAGFAEWGREPAAERLGDGTLADLIWLARLP